MGRARAPLSLHGVARAMLIIGDWCSPSQLAREMGLCHRHQIAYWLGQMRVRGLAERRRTASRGNGYQWRLSTRGNALAIAAPPDNTINLIRYDHRPLAAAMNMPIRPPLASSAPATVHTLEGKWER